MNDAVRARRTPPASLVVGVGVGILALALLAWWLSGARQQLVYEPVSGYSGPARDNPLYSAGRLLERLGVDVVASPSPPDPETLPRDALLMLSQPGYLPDPLVEALFAWVERGGWLVYAARHSYHAGQDVRRDGMLEALQLHVTDGGDAQSEPVTVTLASGEPLPTDHRPAYRLSLERRFALDDRSGYAVAATTADGWTYWLTYHYGDGRIDVAADLDLFANRRLGDAEHARFLWDLLRVGPVPAAVRLHYQPSDLSLPALLWRYGWPLIIGLLVTLAAVLWSAARRLGPMLETPPPASRSLLDHLRAGARFGWRHGARARLLTAAREHAWHELLRRYPDWSRHAPDGQIERLAAFTGIAPARLRAALYPDAGDDGGDALATIQELQRIALRLGARGPAATAPDRQPGDNDNDNDNGDGDGNDDGHRNGDGDGG